MATIVTGSLPAEEFALRESLSRLSGAEFEVEQIVESGEEAVMPLLWVRGADPEAVSEAFEADPSVADPSLLVNVDGDQFYRMEWTERVQLVLQMLTDSEATVTDAYGAGETWYLRVLYPTRDSLSRTIDYCEANGLTFDVDTIRELEGEPAGRYGLTEAQYEALTVAAERGFYDVPRDVTLKELGDELGISHQALSERIRRATLALVEDTLLIGPESEE
ncbi:helix-turn-helix domain-containing protein [Halomarina pelagica]|uniref:helix-turn-helix domain-containing protein n=1 Tax=Halomarina pelagica TaxID=2961599 RepID=UPI0020C4D74F|nr:helix-turn-helix domain-containing protein [Halomarina sp. BND7]